MALTPRATGTIALALKGIDFPCDRAGMVEYARSRNADPDVIAVLEEIPEERYSSMADVFQGMRQGRKGGRRRVPQVQAPEQPPSRPRPQAQSQARQPTARPQPEPRASEAPADDLADLRRIPFALGAPEFHHDAIVPWMWPLQLGLQVMDMWRQAASFWWPQGGDHGDRR